MDAVYYFLNPRKDVQSRGSCGGHGGAQQIPPLQRIGDMISTFGVSADEPGSMLSRALQWAGRLAERIGTPLIVDSGTLLGKIRYGRLLPGDHDLDLSVTAADLDVFRLLKEALVGARHRVWRYDGRIYKIEVYCGRNGPPIPADIKIFTRHGSEWTCPAIGARRGGATQSAVKVGNGMRALLRPLWWALLARDAARLPLRWITRTDTWAVPACFYDDLVEIRDAPGCFMPRDVEGYLTFRYGDWRTPVSNWVSCLHDGAYRQLSPRKGGKL